MYFSSRTIENSFTDEPMFYVCVVYLSMNSQQKIIIQNSVKYSGLLLLCIDRLRCSFFLFGFEWRESRTETETETEKFDEDINECNFFFMSITFKQNMRFSLKKNVGSFCINPPRLCLSFCLILTCFIFQKLQIYKMLFVLFGMTLSLFLNLCMRMFVYLLWFLLCII